MGKELEEYKYSNLELLREIWFNVPESSQKIHQKHFDLILSKLNELQAIKEANPSEALECLEEMWELSCDSRKPEYTLYETIKQALIKAEKEHNSVNLLMQELDCKDFAELRKYARCGYEKMNKKYLKWEDLESFEEQKDFFALLNGNKYTLCRYRDSRNKYVMINLNEINIVTLCDMFKQDIDFFDDLHLEVVEG